MDLQLALLDFLNVRLFFLTFLVQADAFQKEFFAVMLVHFLLCLDLGLELGSVLAVGDVLLHLDRFALDLLSLVALQCLLKVVADLLGFHRNGVFLVLLLFRTGSGEFLLHLCFALRRFQLFASVLALRCFKGTLRSQGILLRLLVDRLKLFL